MLTEGQVSDYKGAAILQHLLPDNSTFLADRGYDATWLRESLKARRGMTVCMLPRKTRNEAFPFDNTLYNQRHLIENIFENSDFASPDKTVVQGVVRAVLIRCILPLKSVLDDVDDAAETRLSSTRGAP